MKQKEVLEFLKSIHSNLKLSTLIFQILKAGATNFIGKLSGKPKPKKAGIIINYLK